MDEDKLIEHTEDMLRFGPFEVGQRVTYHGTLYEIPENQVGVVKTVRSFGEPFTKYIRVAFNGREHNMWIGNLRRIPSYTAAITF
jgi:hypothetical protein